MTTRRGFIQGLLAALGMAAIPAVAVAAPSVTTAVNKGGFLVPPDISDGLDKMRASGSKFVRGRTVTIDTDRFTRFTAVSQELIDDAVFTPEERLGLRVGEEW